MTCELVAVELTDEQKGQVCGILSVGCDRQTAANFVGCSQADIRRAMQQDAAFCAQLCHAEAGVEMSHMRVVQEAAKDVKNWRASVWWLERRSPERYGGRSAGVVTSRQLKSFIAVVVGILTEDIHSADDRQRLVSRLRSIARSVDQMLCDDRENFDAAESIGWSPADVAEEVADDLSDLSNEEWDDADSEAQ